ncbi:MAG TPA: hypothetical protein DEO59_13905 [Balneola sp.]|jgi:hypothetical protein|nr:hypothetical protein [Balneola sp.]
MKKHNRHNTTTSKSIRIRLEEKGLVNNQLLTLISSISLEDLIALKLELACNDINEKLFGFDIWRNLKPIVQESVLKFAISTRKSKKDAARFLGLNYLEFKKLIAKYNVEEYFDL